MQYKDIRVTKLTIFYISTLKVPNDLYQETR